MNEIEEQKSMTAVMQAYESARAVDNAAVIAAEFARIAGLVVTADTLDSAIYAKKKLGRLVKDASASRMTVQRAIKAHEIGRLAFEKSDLERSIEAEYKRIGDAIYKIEHANEAVFRYMIDIRATPTKLCDVKNALKKIGVIEGVDYVIGDTTTEAKAGEMATVVETELV